MASVEPLVDAVKTVLEGIAITSPIALSNVPVYDTEQDWNSDVERNAWEINVEELAGTEDRIGSYTRIDAISVAFLSGDMQEDGSMRIRVARAMIDAAQTAFQHSTLGGLATNVRVTKGKAGKATLSHSQEWSVGALDLQIHRVLEYGT